MENKEGDTPTSEIVTGGSSSSWGFIVEGEGVMKLQEKEKTKLKAAEVVMNIPRAVEKYECVECRKRFYTLKSLGGHVSHHTRMRNRKMKRKAESLRDAKSRYARLEMAEESGEAEVSSGPPLQLSLGL